MASTGSGIGQSQGMILAKFPPLGLAQALSDVRVTQMGYAQTLGAVVKFAKQNGFAQAQTDVSTYYFSYAQASVFVTI